MNLLEPVHVVLDVAHTDGTITGQLAVGGARTASFYGWLELIQLLECAAGRRPLESVIDAEPRGEPTCEP